MLIVLSISIIAVMLTYLSSNRRYRQLKLFQLGFLLVTILQVIHYDYGNDYMGYLSEHMITSVDLKKADSVSISKFEGAISQKYVTQVKDN